MYCDAGLVKRELKSVILVGIRSFIHETARAQFIPHVLGRHKFRKGPGLSRLCYIYFSQLSSRCQLQIVLTLVTTIDSEIYTVIRLDSTFTAEQQLSTDPHMMAIHLASAALNIPKVLQNFRVT